MWFGKTICAAGMPRLFQTIKINGEIMENKYIKLEEKINELVKDGVCIAFSGGFDSNLN